MSETIHLTVQDQLPVGLTTEQARVINAVSPTAEVERTTGGAVLTVHDLNGTTTAVINDGAAGSPGERGPAGPAGQDGSPGRDGVDGKDGSPGRDGVDGYTPIKGVDYFDGAPGRDGVDGQPGTDGHSPVVTASKAGGVTTVSVDGTPIATINDGSDGSPGQTGPQGPQGEPGEDYVLTAQDKADIAGLVDVPSGATAAKVKAGTDTVNFITPSLQSNSVFYGLAKVAGSDMSSSSNAVGTYTDAAKIAIQKMLGIYEPPWELLNDITLQSEGRVDLSADDNAIPYNLKSAYIVVRYPADTPTASTGYARYYFVDENNKSLTALTGKYTTTSNESSKFLYLERKGPLAIAVFSTRDATGNSLTWKNKGLTGYEPNFGNVVRIYINSADVEPAGTRIIIYGQRAY